MRLKAFLLAALCALGAAPAAAQSLQKVVLLHSQPQITAGFAYSSSLPAVLGYWREEGLEVEINPMAGAAAAMQLVVAGKADFAVGNPSGAMIAVQKGANVRFYYTSLRGDIFGIGLPAAGGLNTLQDLKGKTIGVSSFASGGTYYAKGLLRTVGFESGRDYNLVEVGVGARAASALESKQIDTFSLWDEQYVYFAQAGISMSKVIRDPRARHQVAQSILARSDDFAKRKQVLIGLARGIAKAQLFQETNPEAAIRIHWKAFPQTAPRGGITDAAVKKELEIVAVRRPILARNAVGTNQWGDVPRDQMEDFQKYLVATELLPKEIDVGRYYTNELIGEINAFDAAAVVKQARGYKVP